MTSGDIGVTLAVDLSALGYTVPSDGTCALVVAPNVPGAASNTLSPTTVSADRSTVSYTTKSAADVPSDGTWAIQVEVTRTLASTSPYRSPVGLFYVNPAL